MIKYESADWPVISETKDSWAMLLTRPEGRFRGIGIRIHSQRSLLTLVCVKLMREEIKYLQPPEQPWQVIILTLAFCCTDE